MATLLRLIVSERRPAKGHSGLYLYKDIWLELGGISLAQTTQIGDMKTERKHRTIYTPSSWIAI